jgi:hypothetical protein
MSRLVLATANTDFEQRVRDAFDGGVGGTMRPTGVRPKLAERLAEAGITLPGELFGADAA